MRPGTTFTPRSRHSATPPNGAKVTTIHHPSERDTRILKILDPNDGHRFLPSHWLHAHFPNAHPNRFVRRLGHLREDQNAFLKWADFPLNIPLVNTRHGVYELAPKGAKALGVVAPRFRPQELAHEFLNCLVDCSIKFGARANGVEYLTNDPLSIKLDAGQLIPDGRPFVLASGGRTVFFPGKEIDRATEALTSNKLKTTAIARKIDLYAGFMHQRLYRGYGFPNALIPIVTISEGRMRAMMRLVEAMIGPCAWLLFKHTKDWAHEAHFPKPNGDMLTEPWLRVGHPPFSMLTLS
ncbi:MAG: hypothetical protein ACKVP4_08560 [Hyphomicrobium sp.]